jgi:hypothetical protein
MNQKNLLLRETLMLLNKIAHETHGHVPADVSELRLRIARNLHVRQWDITPASEV